MKLFNKCLGQTQPSLIGLDIGTGSIKLVGLQRDADGWTASAAACSVIEPAQDINVRDENTVRAIHECLDKAGIAHPQSAVCAVSGPDVAVCGFEFPPLPNEALDQAIKLESQQVCALDPSHSVIDYQLVETTEHNHPNTTQLERKGYLVVGLEDAIQKKTRIAQQAQIKTVLMDVNNLALINYLLEMPENQESESFAALDAGFSSTSLTILGADGIPFVRHLSGSAQQILTMMSFKTKTSVPEIRKLLAEDSLIQGSAMTTELRNATAKLLGDILETLRFYNLQQGSEKVTRLYLCGGLAIYKPFFRLIQDALSIPVSLIDPLEIIRCPENSNTRKTLEEFGPAMAVAAGLAMRTL